VGLRDINAMIIDALSLVSAPLSPGFQSPDSVRFQKMRKSAETLKKLYVRNLFKLIIKWPWYVTRH